MPQDRAPQLLEPSPPVSILIVDDNPANLVALEAVLAPLGQRMVRASSGEEALRRVLAEDFALILMDGQMPGMDGFQTAALMKQRDRTRDIPLMFVSAVYRETDFAVRGYGIGAVDYIIKPFEPDILRAKVAGIITEHERRERLKAHTRMLLEQERRAMSEQAARVAAEASNRLKDEFIAMVSHELRNPLTNIIGWGDMLRSGRHGADALQKGLESIHRNAVILRDLVEDLLDISRIATGKLRLHRQEADVAELVTVEAQSMRQTAEARGVDFAIVLEPCQALCDPERLRQIVSNLLGNAVKFSPPGGRVVVSLTASADTCEIRVTDQGVGIAPEALPHLFEMFWQGDANVSHRSGGLGLGLAIVQRLVALHGGTVRAESAGLGCGSTFIVSIPRRVDDVEIARDHAAIAGPEAGTLKGLRLLIVDDEEDARDLLAVLVEEAGGEASVAESYAAALAALRRGRYDVVISDLAMPDEDGFTLIQEIRALGPTHIAQIPAVAISALRDEASRARAAEAGYQAFVGKPFRPAELLAAIVTASGRSSVRARVE